MYAKFDFTDGDDGDDDMAKNVCSKKLARKKAAWQFWLLPKLV